SDAAPTGPDRGVQVVARVDAAAHGEGEVGRERSVDRLHVDVGVEAVRQLRGDRTVDGAVAEVAVARQGIHAHAYVAVHGAGVDRTGGGGGFDGSVHGVRFDGRGGAGNTDVAVHRTGVHPHAFRQLHGEMHRYVVGASVIVVRVVTVFVASVAFIPKRADGHVAAVLRDDEVDAAGIGVSMVFLGAVHRGLVAGRRFDINRAIQVAHGKPAAGGDAARQVEGVAVLCLRVLCDRGRCEGHGCRESKGAAKDRSHR